ncbi:MAG: recombinase RecT [Spirochaetales bacterium]|nr:recombinase RecT [Spirochaetales bacterium]
MAQQQPARSQGGNMTTSQYLEKIQNAIMAQLTEKISAMPEGFNKDRFTLNCVTLIRDMLKDKKKRDNLSGISAESIALCMIKGAFLGLDFMSGECYAIPYGGEMSFQTDYKGELKICKKHSINPIKDIFAKLVREGDIYEEIVEDGKQNIIFKPLPFNDAPIVGAFAVVTYKDGSMMYESMSAKEIENIRQTYSKAKDGDAWKKSTGEMYKKTVLRRLSKFIEKDFDKVEQIMSYDEGAGMEFNNALLSTSRKQQPQLAATGQPENLFSTAQTKQTRKKEPVQVTQEQADEFAAFEQQFEQPQQEPQQPENPYEGIDQFDDSELPFN